MKVNKTKNLKKQKKFLYIKGNVKVTICDKKFKQVKKIMNRLNYIVHLDVKNNLIYISAYDTEDTNALERIKDPHDTFSICLEHDLQHHINLALNQLSPEEKQIIDYLFFKGYTLEKVAKLENTYKMDIMRRRNKILAKLRVLLKDYESYIE